MAEVRVTDPTTGGQKGAKPEAYALIPVQPLAEVARVYGYGATKYSDRNWEKGYKWSLSYSAALRHMNAFWNRENTDSESGLSHLAHAAFHMLALMEWVRTRPELDDRADLRKEKARHVDGLQQDDTAGGKGCPRAASGGSEEGEETQPRTLNAEPSGKETISDSGDQVKNCLDRSITVRKINGRYYVRV